jgi:RNA polymerase sigma-70 factor (ECF subfamily)
MAHRTGDRVSTELLQLPLLWARLGTAMNADRAVARAFIERLFAEHHGEIYGYLARLTRDDELAADLAQDTFIKAYRAIDSLVDPSRARSWLFAIANRTALDELRRRQLIRFVPWTGESRGVAASAEETALRGTLSGELERALGRIPARQRSALILAEIHELNGIELAAALNVSHDAARALLTRARESLREALAAERAASRERREAERARTGRGPAGGQRPAPDPSPTKRTGEGD